MQRDHILFIHCWRTVRTAELEASVMMQVGLFGCGWTKKVALARASLMEAANASSVQMSGVVSLGSVFRRSCKGWRIWTQLETKQW